MRWRERATAAAGMTALAVAIFAIGGAPRWSQAIVAAVVAAAMIPNLRSRKGPVRVSPLVAMLGAAAGLTAVQLIPLPTQLLDTLNPVGAALRDDGAALVGASTWPAITLDWPATLRALFALVTLLGVAVVALRLAVTERGRYRLLTAVGAAAGGAAVITCLHEVLGAAQLYGLYTPQHAVPSVLGPLLNENHLGCLMALGAVVSLGLIGYRRQRSWLRAAWVVNAGACAALTVASQSRGAALALGAGILVVGVVLLAQRLAPGDTPRKGRANFLTNALPIGVVAACAVVIVVYASAGGISRELSRTSIDDVNSPRSKYAAWRSATTLIDEAPLLGTGRGAFEAAFTRVHDASAVQTFSHVENEYVQAAVDWGLVGAGTLALLGIWALIVAIRRWRDGPLAAGALGGVAVVALQSNVDFGIDLLGIAVPSTIVAASLLYVPIKEEFGHRLAVIRGTRIAHVVGLALAAVLLLAPVTRTMAEDRAALATPRSTADELRAAVARHPLDYYLYAQAAQLDARAHKPSAVRLLNHALTLHPSHPGLHRLAARWLIRAGYPRQAASEYVAVMRGTTNPRATLAEIARLFSSRDAIAAIPFDSHPPREIVRALDDADRSELGTAWLIAMLDGHPGHVGVCQLLYERALQRGDLDAVRSATQRCKAVEPTPEERVQLARLLRTKGGHAEVIELLADVEVWSGKLPVRASAWLERCEALAELRRWDEAKRCWRRLDASGVASPALQQSIPARLEAIEVEIKRAIDEPPGGEPPPAPASPAQALPVPPLSAPR